MKREPIQFLTAPRVGKVIKFDGQRYVLVEHRLHYRKRDGEPTVILNWESQCADCEATFATTTPLSTPYITRRCKKHRKPGRPVVYAKASNTRMRKGGAK
jgi:hypothetical protein